ncbi:MAG: heavy-metal-associated domain-containing protein [Sulfurimonas sp.]|nr:heavy-metal-associated domain-containing protein [Sulfurimonas sp.]
MKTTIKVQNVKCGGCASTLTNKLKDKFGEIEVNLEVMPREITLDIEDDKLDALHEALKGLGYPVAGESFGFIEDTSMKAKSFVSCAIGKIDNFKEGK